MGGDLWELRCGGGGAFLEPRGHRVLTALAGMGLPGFGLDTNSTGALLGWVWRDSFAGAGDLFILIIQVGGGAITRRELEGKKVRSYA